MSTNPISSSSQTNLAAILGSANRPHRHGGGGGDREGINLLASLLQALTQAVSAGATATATATGATAETNTATTDGTTAAAGTTAATATGSTTSGTSLAQDLQAFLHDLFHALRDAGRPSHGGGYASAPRPVTTPSPTGAIAAPAATSNGIATAAASAAGTTGVGAYGQRSIISALRALVQDLSNSQVLSTTGSSSSLSSNALSNLNSAFEKLIGDLGASTSTAGSSTVSGSAAASGQSTSALQSFLTNFMQDLQSNGTNSLSSLGSSVNTTA
jgi:hypothetical protein